jgi:PhzF family phenazine biosynthesis protein
MKLPLFQVDAFTGDLFRGNPAAVVLLKRLLDDRTLQAIAAENNLAETAFILPNDDHFDLRWFTPNVEVDLCGHATLAGAFVLFGEGIVEADEVRFETCSGPLSVRRGGGRLVMDFPSRAPEPIATPETLVEALGKRPIDTLAARDLLAVFATEEEVVRLEPDFRLLKKLDAFAVCVTAPGEDCDFVSRFFAPKAGIDEDPVTGSAHCTLTPYWASKLGKKELFARQVSPRGGEIRCTDRGDRVSIAGKAVLYLRGEISV